jgi:hypothetical protein
MDRVGSIACERGHTWTKKINRPITPEKGRSLAQREESSQSPSPGQMRLSQQVEVGLEAGRVREADLAQRAEAETRRTRTSRRTVRSFFAATNRTQPNTRTQ